MNTTLPITQRENPQQGVIGDLRGWGLFFSGIFLMFNACRLPLRVLRQPGDSLLVGFSKACSAARSLASLLGSVILVPMGFGVARRYVFGLWLAYGFLFLLACIAVAGSARGDGVLTFAMPAWVMILIYYQNRRNVFGYVVRPSIR